MTDYTVTGAPARRWTGPDGEPTLADVQREFPGWHSWRGISGLLYARPAAAGPGEPAQVKGEDPRDLRDMIIRANAERAVAEYVSASQ